MDPLNPFRYEPGGGTVFSPFVALPSLAVLSATASAAAMPAALVPGLAAAIFLAARGERPGAIVRRASFLAPAAFLVVAAGVALPGDGRLFAPRGIMPGLAYLARLASIFLVAEAYFRTTGASGTGAAVTTAVRLFLRPFRTPPGDPGIYVGLAAGFLPRSFDTYARVRDAALARGFASRPGKGRRNRGGATGNGAEPGEAAGPGRRPRGGGETRSIPRMRVLSRNVAGFLVLAETFVSISLRSAVWTAMALQARGYRPGRTVLAPRPGRADAALAVAAGALSTLCLLYRG